MIDISYDLIKLLILIVMIVGVLTMFGCTPEITEGRVDRKEHLEESTTIIYMPITITNGNTTTTIMSPMYIFNPETWRIIIKAYSEEKKEFVYEDFYVEEDVFNEIDVGDYFKFDEEMGTKERPEIEREATEEEEKSIK